MSCIDCGKPFSPTHDASAPGPTVRHPYREAPNLRERPQPTGDFWHGWRVGAESTCPDCHERVVLQATRPPRWTHQPAGASFQDGTHLYCHRTTAHPAVRSWEHGIQVPVAVYEDEPRRLVLEERGLQELRLRVAQDTGWELDPTLPTRTWTLRTAHHDDETGTPLPPLWTLLTRWQEYT